MHSQQSGLHPSPIRTPLRRLHAEELRFELDGDSLPELVEGRASLPSRPVLTAKASRVVGELLRARAQLARLRAATDAVREELLGLMRVSTYGQPRSRTHAEFEAQRAQRSALQSRLEQLREQVERAEANEHEKLGAVTLLEADDFILGFPVSTPTVSELTDASPRSDLSTERPVEIPAELDRDAIKAELCRADQPVNRYYAWLLDSAVSAFSKNVLDRFDGPWLERLALIFSRFDDDGDGLLSFDEFSRLMVGLVGARATGTEYSDRELRCMFRQADINGDYRLDLNELAAMISPPEEPASRLGYALGTLSLRIQERTTLESDPTDQQGGEHGYYEHN